MIVVRPISLAKEHFNMNSATGNFSLKEGDRFVQMNPQQEEEFLSTNFAIGYTDRANIRLRINASRQARGLDVFNLEGTTLEGKRVLLWRNFRGGQIPEFISSILATVKAGKSVTLWYLSSDDIEVANIIAKFVVWFVTNSK